MSRIVWTDLFPTKFSFVIFVAYIFFCVNQGILVTASQGPNNSYVYNTVTVVLFTEILKLILASLLYWKDNTVYSLFEETVKHSNVLGLYFVPAFLYCIYNNLAFSSLASFDPTTYYLLLQLRVVITGILFQIIFKKQLSRKQWISLIILMFGCMLRGINFDIFFSQQTEKSFTETLSDNRGNNNLESKIITIHDIGGLLIILIQVLCSCSAGVYNENLLKTTGLDVNIFVQNVFMYVDSIICNVLVLLLQGKLHDSFSYDSLQSVFHYKVLLIMINNACVGIITSLFLKSLNSILKTFASALELAFTATFSYLLLGISVKINTILAITVVSYAVFLYSKAPVSNIPVKSKSLEEDREALLETV